MELSWLINIAMALVGAGGLLTAALTAWIPRKGSLENERIDQLQEDLKESRDQVSSLNSRMDELDSRIRASEQDNRYWRSRDMAWATYFHEVNIATLNNQVPPLPERPEELRKYPE